ncbi:peptidoglycan DD-metalloendopeptidase family protein [Nocardia sp. R7R-8]|uniref:peptidoglycan DD-metalloendopeptidase family protein n=1 Tax=Nocardia sp. R7R-8 TaxID=3459304 RepID=UPI00403E0B9F
MSRSNDLWRGRRLSSALALGLAATVATMPTATARPEGRFGWPLQPRPAVVRHFDKPAQNWLPGHRGVDLAGTEGQAVLTAGEGIVVFAGTVAGKPVVSIDHPGGLRTTYEPVRAEVPVGTRVGRGVRIGALESGHPGCVTACLHWGARVQGGRRRDPEYLDPLGLLHLTALRLKPVRPGSGAGRSAASPRIGRRPRRPRPACCRQEVARP